SGAKPAHSRNPTTPTRTTHQPMRACLRSSMLTDVAGASSTSVPITSIESSALLLPNSFAMSVLDLLIHQSCDGKVGDAADERAPHHDSERRGVPVPPAAGWPGALGAGVDGAGLTPPAAGRAGAPAPVVATAEPPLPDPAPLRWLACAMEVSTWLVGPNICTMPSRS